MQALHRPADLWSLPRSPPPRRTGASYVIAHALLRYRHWVGGQQSSKLLVLIAIQLQIICQSWDDSLPVLKVQAPKAGDKSFRVSHLAQIEADVALLIFR